MKISIYTVDAFTSVPFAGNPAAVCLLEESIGDDKMQKIAIEMNLSETAFIEKIKATDTFKSSSRFKLRWFTPSHEVALCGHATLASAAVLFYCLNNETINISFDTLSGWLVAERNSKGIKLDLPLNPPTKIENYSDDSCLQELVNISSCSCDVKEVWLSKSTKKLLIRLSDDISMEKLTNLEPQIDKMMKMHSTGEIMGIILTIRGTKENGCMDVTGSVYDFVSRYFAPWHGINEDPVTGSAHTVLAGYWAEEIGKNSFYVRQCSKRGGELDILIQEPKNIDGQPRVDLIGNAAIVLEGHLNI